MGITFGTLHIANCGRQRIVVCSDSRGHSEHGPVGDDFQKLFQSGKRTLCGISGVLTWPPGIYVSSRVASVCAEDSLEDSPRELLCAIRDDLHGALTALFAENPLPDLPSAFSAFSVRRKRNGEIDLLELNFPVIAASDGHRLLGEPEIKSHLEGVLPSGPFVYHIGRSDCLTKDLEKRLDPDLPDGNVLKDIDNIFETARAVNGSCRDEVGGPIDVAAIDSVGFRWLRRKPISL